MKSIEQLVRRAAQHHAKHVTSLTGAHIVCCRKYQELSMSATLAFASGQETRMRPAETLLLPIGN
ncbi:hypothetical protein [Noviherbaspirillum sp.]|uniref:hypothetical protein n=1 Tax=Noviherbaspirillum sp. TaxID=1926288 RepID=UPI002B459FF4|nr:hypothetical protein [Noviherbaspirillum sp.]HJV80448.1 hypothetical protein [Noviherbaspirillum sp.]